MPVFGKTPQNQDPTFGSTTADAEEATVFTDGESGNEELMVLAKKKAIEDAVQAEINRAEVDKSKEIVYSKKVEYDPKSCKK